MTTLRTALFDLDGVLVDAGRRLFEALHLALGRILEVRSCDEVDYPRVSRYIEEAEREAALA